MSTLFNASFILRRRPSHSSHCCNLVRIQREVALHTADFASQLLCNNIVTNFYPLIMTYYDKEYNINNTFACEILSE